MFGKIKSFVKAHPVWTVVIVIAVYLLLKRGVRSKTTTSVSSSAPATKPDPAKEELTSFAYRA